MRSAGKSGSSGTYAPPALSVPKIATSRSADRSIQRPTRSPGATPSDLSLPATRLALRSSSSYVSRSSKATTASDRGDSRTTLSKSSCRQASSGNGNVSSFHSSRTRRRSSDPMARSSRTVLISPEFGSLWRSNGPLTNVPRRLHGRGNSFQQGSVRQGPSVRASARRSPARPERGRAEGFPAPSRGRRAGRGVGPGPSHARETVAPTRHDIGPATHVELAGHGGRPTRLAGPVRPDSGDPETRSRPVGARSRLSGRPARGAQIL